MEINDDVYPPCIHMDLRGAPHVEVDTTLNASTGVPPTDCKSFTVIATSEKLSGQWVWFFWKSIMMLDHMVGINRTQRKVYDKCCHYLLKGHSLNSV